MKKLSLLIALCMLLTIGGVYATWSYVGSTDIIDAYAESKVTIADAEIEGTNGVYKIESNLVLTVDQANDNHEAEHDAFRTALAGNIVARVTDGTVN